MTFREAVIQARLELGMSRETAELNERLVSFGVKAS